jgi:hypothetical protein
VATAPDYLTLKRHRDEAGRHEPVFRRVGLALVGAVLLLGLLNVFGQRPATTRATAPAADLQLYAPSRVRSGLIFEARLIVNARRELKKARILLAPGWIEGITMNSAVPSPLGEASDDGRVSFELGHIPAGRRYVLFLQLQVNPTVLGRRAQDVELVDGAQRIARIERTFTIFP